MAASLAFLRALPAKVSASSTVSGRSGNSASVLTVSDASRGEGSHGGAMRAAISRPFLTLRVARISVAGVMAGSSHAGGAGVRPTGGRLAT